MKNAVVAAALAMFAITAAASAETLRLSLDDAIRSALSEGTQARLAESQARRADISRREALSGLLPQSEARLEKSNQSINLATFGFTLPGFPAVVGPFNVVDAQITASMQLFNLAALRYYQASQQGVKASRAAFEQARNDVAAAVARLYIVVQRADAQVASRNADVTLFTQLARVANDEFQAGTGTRLDVAQANVQLARAREALLRAQNDRESARLALLNAIGADESAQLVLANALETPPAAPRIEDALSTATARRPELRQFESAVRAAELMVSSARDRRLPRLELHLQGDISGNHVDDLHSTRTIAGALAVPVFRGDLEANIARAKLELEDIRTRAGAARRDVEQQVRSSILALENAAERVSVANENTKVAEEALQIARDRKAAGYGSSVEVDRAEDTYRQAHEDLIAAQADATLAYYELQHATGTIGDRVASLGPAPVDRTNPNPGTLPANTTQPQPAPPLTAQPSPITPTTIAPGTTTLPPDANPAPPAPAPAPPAPTPAPPSAQFLGVPRSSSEFLGTATARVSTNEIASPLRGTPRNSEVLRGTAL